MNKTAVFLDDRQAQLFLLLSKANAFDIQSGNVEINFDEKGWPVKVKVTCYTTLSTPSLKVEIAV